MTAKLTYFQQHEEYKLKMHNDANRETLKVSQITMVAEDIPASFPIRAASTVLDYKDTDISGQTFMLHSNALVDMTVDGVLSRNEKRFWNFGKYSADSSISFGDPPSDDPPVKKKQ